LLLVRLLDPSSPDTTTKRSVNEKMRLVLTDVRGTDGARPTVKSASVRRPGHSAIALTTVAGGAERLKIALMI
jgi:hypothetical protein